MEDNFSVFADDEWIILKDDETRLHMCKGVPDYNVYQLLNNPLIRIDKVNLKVTVEASLSSEQLYALAGYIKELEDKKNETDEQVD